MSESPSQKIPPPPSPEIEPGPPDEGIASEIAEAMHNARAQAPPRPINIVPKNSPSVTQVSTVEADKDTRDDSSSDECEIQTRGKVSISLRDLLPTPKFQALEKLENPLPSTPRPQLGDIRLVVSAATVESVGSECPAFTVARSYIVTAIKLDEFISWTQTRTGRNPIPPSSTQIRGGTSSGNQRGSETEVFNCTNPRAQNLMQVPQVQALPAHLQRMLVVGQGAMARAENKFQRSYQSNARTRSSENRVNYEQQERSYPQSRARDAPPPPRDPREQNNSYAWNDRYRDTSSRSQYPNDLPRNEYYDYGHGPYEGRTRDQGHPGDYSVGDRPRRRNSPPSPDRRYGGYPYPPQGRSPPYYRERHGSYHPEGCRCEKCKGQRY